MNALMKLTWFSTSNKVKNHWSNGISNYILPNCPSCIVVFKQSVKMPFVCSVSNGSLLLETGEQFRENPSSRQRQCGGQRCIASSHRERTDG